MPTKLDSSIELRLPSLTFIAYFSKRPTSWPTFTAFTLFTHGRSTPNSTGLFRPSLQLPSLQFLSLPPLPPVIRLPLPPSSMHHHSLPPHKHPQPPPLHHHHHNPRRNANLHHPVRLVELKTDARLRPNWNYVARRVGFSIEQCKARWEELQEAQSKRKAVTPPPSPTPTSPANTPPPPSPVPSPPSAAAIPPPAPPSAPDFSYTPTTPPSLPPAAAAMDDAMPATISEDSHLEPEAADIGSYFV